MDNAAVRFPPRLSVVAYNHRPQEHALSSAAVVVPLSPRARFEAIRQRDIAALTARGMLEPDRGERASELAANDLFLWHACPCIEDIVHKLIERGHVLSRGVYVPLAEHAVYAAFAHYIGCVEAGARSGSSALAAFHRAMPVEQRDDEWHAVDAVLHHHRYQQQYCYHNHGTTI
jgi:hypothetical protein